MFGLISLFLGIFLVATVASADSLDFTAATTAFEPLGAWQAFTGNICDQNKIMYSTTANNANLTFEYTGNNVLISGFSNASTGLIEMHIDGNLATRYSLASAQQSCGVLFGYNNTNDPSMAHTATLILLDSGYPTRLDINDITFGTPTPGRANTTFSTTVSGEPVIPPSTFGIATASASEAPSATSTSSTFADPVFVRQTNVGIIVGVAVGSVAGTLILGGAFFWFIRKRRVASYNRRMNLLASADPTPQMSAATIIPVVVGDNQSEVDMKVCDIETPPPSYASDAGSVAGKKSKH